MVSRVDKASHSIGFFLTCFDSRFRVIISFVDNRMSTMSRVSNASRSAMLKAQTVSRGSRATTLRSLATASGDDAKKPTALAKLHLEDGTTLVGYSFGSHQAVEGEVSDTYIFYSRL